MWVTKTFDFSSKKLGFFAQKRPNLARNWHFCPLLAHLVPCWWFLRVLYLARHLFTLYYYIIIWTLLLGMRGPKHVGELSTEDHPGQLWQFFNDREVKTINILRIPLFSI